ncbi:sterol carrier family protein [Nocardioides sp. NPDC101246]|uniref:sterol carrier family protein n=1 Tax=Nocardioides sp. NPDC101246 TaxID=3364336 RepID=UPI00381C5959
MPARLKPAPAAEVSAALDRLATGSGTAAKADLRLLTKHFLALLEQRAPGRSVEVRVPPFAAVQCVEGVRHTRGTPPAVIETDAVTWIALATGEMTWSDAVDQARVRASGERTDLSAYLPLGATAG